MSKLENGTWGIALAFVSAPSLLLALPPSHLPEPLAGSRPVGGVGRQSEHVLPGAEFRGVWGGRRICGAEKGAGKSLCGLRVLNLFEPRYRDMFVCPAPRPSGTRIAPPPPHTLGGTASPLPTRQAGGRGPHSIPAELVGLGVSVTRCGCPICASPTRSRRGSLIPSFTVLEATLGLCVRPIQRHQKRLQGGGNGAEP